MRRAGSPAARFFDEYLAPNAVHALAHFNELVSGYWLGKEEALLVRRPACWPVMRQGRLHSATGKCIEYRDGWGFYAWHGVRVPEQVILAPETLTREDFLSERECGGAPRHPGAHGRALCVGTGRACDGQRPTRDALRGALASG